MANSVISEDAAKAMLDAGLCPKLNGGKVVVYDDQNAALVTINLPATAFAAATVPEAQNYAQAALVVDPEVSGLAGADGDADHYKGFDSLDAEVISGTCGVAESGAEMILDHIILANGEKVKIVSWHVRMPRSA